MAAISITPGSVLMVAGGSKRTVTSGGTITAGMCVYEDTATSTWKPARANAAATSAASAIALCGASSGQQMVIQEAGSITIGGTVVAGIVYCVSDAVAGEIIPSADYGSGDYPAVIGVASSTSVIQLGFIAPGAVRV